MGLFGSLLKALPGIGTAVSIGEGVYGAVKGLSQMGQANNINPAWKPRTTSPYAQKQLGLAQTMLNGRMPGAANEEANIAANQAGTVANINNNATDSATALSLATGAQGQSNNAYANLATKEAQDRGSLIDNLNNAYKTMANEDELNYQNELQKYGMDVNSKAMLNQAGANNLFGGIDKAAGGLIMSPYTLGRGGIGTGLGGGKGQYGGRNNPYYRM